MQEFFFIYIVGIEVFSKLLIMYIICSNRIKNKQDTASKVFRQSPGIIPKIIHTKPNLIKFSHIIVISQMQNFLSEIFFANERKHS
jgi:hypothetical protein